MVDDRRGRGAAGRASTWRWCCTSRRRPRSPRCRSTASASIAGRGRSRGRHHRRGAAPLRVGARRTDGRRRCSAPRTAGVAAVAGTALAHLPLGLTAPSAPILSARDVSRVSGSCARGWRREYVALARSAPRGRASAPGFPDRRLGNVARGAPVEKVPEINDGFEQSNERYRRRRGCSPARPASSIVLATLVSLVSRCARTSPRGTENVLRLGAAGGEHDQRHRVRGDRGVLPVGDAGAAASVVPSSTCCTACARSPTSSTCTSSTRTPSRPVPTTRPTAKSPRAGLNAEELHHYFDYCSELVSLIAKTAALCAEHTSDSGRAQHRQRDRDPAAQMSQKIWQKISLLPDH